MAQLPDGGSVSRKRGCLELYLATERQKGLKNTAAVSRIKVLTPPRQEPAVFAFSADLSRTARARSCATGLCCSASNVRLVGTGMTFSKVGWFGGKTKDAHLGYDRRRRL